MYRKKAERPRLEEHFEFKDDPHFKGAIVITTPGLTRTQLIMTDRMKEALTIKGLKGPLPSFPVVKVTTFKRIWNFIINLPSYFLRSN